jgi:hypothetical protein
LLNDPAVANTVALDEPFYRPTIAATSAGDFPQLVEDSFRRFRQSLVENGEAPCTVGAGGLENHYDGRQSSTGLRERVVSAGMLKASKPLGANFRLVVKHTMPFTGMIEELRQRYPVRVIVRNPVAILASWNTIDASYWDGLPPAYASHLCGNMPWLIKAARDRIERQVVLLDWHFEKYLPLLPDGSVIRYEDVIESGGAALERFSPAAGALSVKLSSQNANTAYDSDLIDKIKISLQRLGGVMWHFYARDEANALAGALKCRAREQRAPALAAMEKR